MNSRATTRSPFTPTQWQELEHQALIYKYMVSGVPIPPELIFSVKRSLESSLAARLFPPHHFGWGGLQVGYGRKPDPEPGRCRRTDGKKWRCSKEAYPDSKYCEKHMHRGKNRSRKPVEQSSTSTNATPSSSSTAITTSPTTSSYSFPANNIDSDNGLSSLINPFIYNYSSDAKPLPASSFASQPSEKDYRFYNGMDERTFFPDNTFNSCLGDSHKALYQEADHCFVLGADIKSQSSRSMRMEKEAEIQKPMHHFFGDQWSTKGSGGSWLDLASSTTN